MKYKSIRPSVLYRQFDAQGVLLYIGISGAFADRLRAHRGHAPWFTEIKTITLEHYPTHGQAAIAELNAIRTEQPRYNTCHMGESAAASARRAKRIESREAFEAAKRQEELDIETKIASILANCKP